MESTVKERLIWFIKYLKLSQRKFEEKVGLSNGYINNISKGIGAEKLQKILYEFPNLNQKWLLTGEGEMLNEPNLTPIPLPDSEATTPYTENSNGIRFLKQGDALKMEVPLVQYNALGSPEDEYAALLNDREGGEVMLFTVDKVYHGKYFAFVVDGDSMDDGSRQSFGRGDTVLVRELDRDDWLPHLHIKDWPFWVVCWGNNVRLKQITRQDGDTITLHSLNPSPEYTDFTLPLDSIRRLFNVIQHVPHPISY